MERDTASEPRLADEAVECAATFQAIPPTTIIVSCADGRFAIEDADALAALGVHETPDRQTPPGGPAALLERSAATPIDDDVSLRRLTFLIQHHQTRRILLVAHADCGHYRSMFPTDSGEQRFRRQLLDLRAVAEDLRRRFPALEVTCLYARARGGHVAIHRVIE
jgi:carbonic anhydrase